MIIISYNNAVKIGQTEIWIIAEKTGNFHMNADEIERGEEKNG